MLLLLFQNNLDEGQSFVEASPLKYIPTYSDIKRRDYTGGSSTAVLPGVTVLNQGLKPVVDDDGLFDAIKR